MSREIVHIPQGGRLFNTLSFIDPAVQVVFEVFIALLRQIKAQGTATFPLRRYNLLLLIVATSQCDICEKCFVAVCSQVSMVDEMTMKP